MTTPVDIVMPYGVTVVGDGSNYPAIDGDHPRKVTGSSIELTPGPCKVSASWEGPDRAILQVSNGGKTRSLATIPEKTGGGVTFCHGAHRGTQGGSCIPLREQAHGGCDRHLGGLPAQFRVTDYAGAVV